VRTRRPAARAELAAGRGLPSAGALKLDERDIERIAARVAEILREDLLGMREGAARLADASTVARMLGVERDWVYAHAQELGAIRLGGPRGRLRFDLDRIQSRLASGEQPAPPQPRTPVKRPPGSSKVDLLPYAESPAVASRRPRAPRATSL
jgi:hypothetical protein